MFGLFLRLVRAWTYDGSCGSHIRFASKDGRDKSIHTSAWPTVDEVDAVDRPEFDGVFEVAVEMLATIRGAKTKAQKSLRWPVSKLEIVGPEADRKALQVALEDVLRAGHVDSGAVVISDGPSPENRRFAVTIELAEAMPE